MKFIFSLLILFCSVSAVAQPAEWKAASKESRAYHAYRVRPTVPPYGLIKIKEIIKQIKADDDDNEMLSQEAYEALSFREKFTYHMIHGESYSQNCDAMPPIQDEHKKIFANIPDMFEEYAWSDRQATFLKSNRDSVIALMKESITRSKRVGLNFKHAIIEINATEMIPFLIKTHKEIKKDLDLLTLMLLLMKENEYDPFIASGSYRKLYGEEAGYMSYLNYNKANEELIIKRAAAFYNENKK
jgi:hypothetical protein